MNRARSAAPARVAAPCLAAFVTTCACVPVPTPPTAPPPTVFGPARFVVEAPSDAALNPFADPRVAFGASLHLVVTDDADASRSAAVDIGLDPPGGASATVGQAFEGVPFGDVMSIAVELRAQVVDGGADVVIGRGAAHGVAVHAEEDVPVRVLKPLGYVGDAGGVHVVDLSSLSPQGGGVDIVSEVDALTDDLTGVVDVAATSDGRFVVVADALARVVAYDTLDDTQAATIALGLGASSATRVLPIGDTHTFLVTTTSELGVVVVVDVDAGTATPIDVPVPTGDNALITAVGADVDGTVAYLALLVDDTADVTGGDIAAVVACVDLATLHGAFTFTPPGPQLSLPRDVRVAGDRVALLRVDDDSDVGVVHASIDVYDSLLTPSSLSTFALPAANPDGENAVSLAVHPRGDALIVTLAPLAGCCAGGVIHVSLDGTALFEGAIDGAVAAAASDGVVAIAPLAGFAAAANGHGFVVLGDDPALVGDFVNIVDNTSATLPVVNAAGIAVVFGERL